MVKRNIVDLNVHRQPSSTSPGITLPQLVISAQRRAKHHIKTLFPDYFAKIDDSLFARADKAENNQEQSLFFDAMRNMRLQKEAFEKTYFNELVKGFRDALAKSAGTGGIGSLDQISLVDDDTLENSLAITNMASHAENLCREALFGLTARLDFLIEDIEITKYNNPLRPDVFCQAIVPAVDSLDLDLKVRLVIYKLFDTCVVQHLGAMYNAINADLISAGVLPRIKSTIQKSDGGRMAPRQSGGYESGTGENDSSQYAGAQYDAQGSTGYFDGNRMLPEVDPNHPEGLFGSLQELLSMSRGGMAADGRGVAGGARGAGGQPVRGAGMSGGIVGGMSGMNNGGTAQGGQGMVYYAPQDVLSALSNLQTTESINLFDPAGDGNKEQPSANIIKDVVLQEMLRVHGADSSKQIDQNDNDAIDIVSMLFDFILDDPTLSDHIKAQIARLQIPMLKVAILDKAFFAKKTHPARQLLNEMAYAGGALDEHDPQGDATFQMVKYVVDRVLDEFEQDPGLFSELLGEFTTFIEQERESNKLAEEMLEQARDTVAREIQRRITDNMVPPLVNNILITAWKDVLTHLYLRDGEESTAWNTALQVADDLIWSIQPKLVVAERQRLIKVIPRVLNGLRDGLTLIRYDAAATEQLFAGLETLHIASLRGSSIDMEEVAAVPTLNPMTPHSVVEPLLSDDDFGLDLKGSDLPEETSTVSMQKPLADDDIMEEIVLASTHNPWDEFSSENEMEMELKDMALGTWVEFIDAETERRRRGKLAWKCDFTGEFTFVDRKYKVVADLSFQKLVEEFSVGRASIIEDVPLFDRALDSVIGGIKHALSKNSEPTMH